MDVTVSARIPEGLRAGVAEKLQAAGLTTTDLIRNAFDYFATAGKLPKPKEPVAPGIRSISPSQLQAFREDTRTCHVSVNDEHWQNIDYKDFLSKGRLADYEALP